MMITNEIGGIFRRIRRDKMWTLQKTCDATFGELSPTHLSKIENGTAPSVYVASNIARCLGTSLDEIMKEVYGESKVKPPQQLAKTVPILSTIQAGAWSSSPTKDIIDEFTQWLTVPREKIPQHCYALKVNGDSMQSAGKVSFPDGCYIVVDPNKSTEHGDYVVAMKSDSEESTFKQLIFDSGKKYLKPLNSQYPMLEIDQETIFCGCAIDLIIKFD